MSPNPRRPTRRRLFDAARSLFPACCLACGCRSDGSPDLCAACRHWLPTTADCLCIRCGRPFGAVRPAAAEALDVCRDCAAMPWIFSDTVVPWRFEEPVRTLVTGLKYRARRQHARVLGELLADTVRDKRRDTQWPDALVPVPMPPGRWRRRGFDHAHEIARWCGRRLGLPVWPRAVTRRQETVSLAGLNRAARQAAIVGMFACRVPVAGRHVAIVDDVLTTGATCTELARELLDQGVERVELWAVARTPAP